MDKQMLKTVCSTVKAVGDHKLMYDTEKGEYIYKKDNHIVWKEKGNSKLCDAFVKAREHWQNYPCSKFRNNKIFKKFQAEYGE